MTDDSTYVWNLKNKQNRNKLIDIENILIGEVGGMGVKGEEVKRYNLPVINSHRDA